MATKTKETICKLFSRLDTTSIIDSEFHPRAPI